jgi:hypothetical protein
MVWDVKTSRLIIAPRTCFLLLIIKGLFSSSSSSKSFAIFCSLAHICLDNLLDDVIGHLVCCHHSLSSKVLTPKVEASCTPVGTSCGGIC